MSLNSRAGRLLAATLTGLLFAASFPPFGLEELVWIALVPLLWASHRTDTSREAFLCGFIAGTVAGLLTIYSLTSSDTWVGWGVIPDQELPWDHIVYLKALWILLSLWGGGLFWGAFAAVFRLAGGFQNAAAILLTPCLWVLISEWGRVNGTWGFHWVLAGYATADIMYLPQAAALGGVWLLSWVVVFVNAVISFILVTQNRRSLWEGLIAASLLVGVSTAAGVLEYSSLPISAPLVRVSTIHHPSDSYRTPELLLDDLHQSFPQIFERSTDKCHGAPHVIVLPESVGRGVLSLDGTTAPNSHISDSDRHDLREWSEPLTRALRGSQAVLAYGMDTVEGGELHNSLLFVNSSGVTGWYHKIRLVPFGEYQPRYVPVLPLRRAPQYSPGLSGRLVRQGDLQIGAFICSEVHHPSLTRNAVLAGANLILSGANDGVFRSRAVAEMHANMAKIRAVETGRTIVRAVSGGVSAILDPTGHESVSVETDSPALLDACVTFREHQTFYMRHGDWVLWAALFPIAAFLVWRTVLST